MDRLGLRSGHRSEVQAKSRRVISADEVQAFIRERVPRYRDALAPDVSADVELALFPFAASAANTAVSSGSKPLRSVKHWLQTAIEKRHKKLFEQPGLTEFAAASRDDLHQRLII